MILLYEMNFIFQYIEKKLNKNKFHKCYKIIILL